MPAKHLDRLDTAIGGIRRSPNLMLLNRGRRDDRRVSWLWWKIWVCRVLCCCGRIATYELAITTAMASVFGLRTQ